MISELVVDVQPKEVSIAVLEDKNLVELQKEARNVSFSVGIMTDPNDLETFEPITSFTVYKRATWTEFFSFFGESSRSLYKSN